MQVSELTNHRYNIYIYILSVSNRSMVWVRMCGQKNTPATIISTQLSCLNNQLQTQSKEEQEIIQPVTATWSGHIDLETAPNEIYNGFL